MTDICFSNMVLSKPLSVWWGREKKKNNLRQSNKPTEPPVETVSRSRSEVKKRLVPWTSRRGPHTGPGQSSCRRGGTAPGLGSPGRRTPWPGGATPSGRGLTGADLRYDFDQHWRDLKPPVHFGFLCWNMQVSKMFKCKRIFFGCGWAAPAVFKGRINKTNSITETNSVNWPSWSWRWRQTIQVEDRGNIHELLFVHLQICFSATFFPLAPTRRRQTASSSVNHRKPFLRADFFKTCLRNGLRKTGSFSSNVTPLSQTYRLSTRPGAWRGRPGRCRWLRSWCRSLGCSPTTRHPAHTQFSSLWEFIEYDKNSKIELR